MVGRGGALSIKMLRRTVSFENKEARAGTIQGLRRRGQIPDRVWGGGGRYQAWSGEEGAGTSQGLGRKGWSCIYRFFIPPAPAPSQAASLDIPKKTKVFVDQTVRERDNPCST